MSFGVVDGDARTMGRFACRLATRGGRFVNWGLAALTSPLPIGLSRRIHFGKQPFFYLWTDFTRMNPRTRATKEPKLRAVFSIGERFV